MKKLLIVLFLFLSVHCYSQINTLGTKSIKQAKVTVPYDSINNYVGENYYQYIGQIFYIPLSDSNKNIGYDGFNKKPLTGTVYKPKNRYSHSSKYEDLAGKYFEVLDTVTNKYSTIFLKLRETVSKDIILFKYNPKSEYLRLDFPFIVVGYYEKQKQKVVGELFAILSFSTYGAKDIETGDEISFNVKDNSPKLYNEWLCVDYLIDEGYMWDEVLILENNKGQKIKMPIKDAFITNKVSLEAERELRNKEAIEKKYGELKIGMSASLCRLICGKPKSINKTIASSGMMEQWVYADKYLYFENDILVTIQSEIK